MNTSILTLSFAGAMLAVTGMLAGCGDDADTDGSGGSSSVTTTTTTATTADTTTTTTTGGGEGGAGGGGSEECKTDICATYGAAVPTAAGLIVDRAAADPEFEADFAPLVAAGPEAVDAFKASLAAFIADAYGCTTGAYTGPTMEAAHAGLGITQMEYDDFVTLIAGVLSDAGVPADDINYCFAPALVDPAFAATIIGK